MQISNKEHRILNIEVKYNDMNRLINHISLTLLVAVLLISCGKREEPQAEAHHEESENTAEFTSAQVEIAHIKLGKVEQKLISGTIRANGVLDVPPQQMVSISVPFGGFLKSTPLLQGVYVRKGQQIAVIENPEYIQFQQDYLEASNQHEFSKADYERQQQLARENVNAQKTLQQAKATFQTWEAKRNGLLTRLRLLNIDTAALRKGHITSTASVYAPIDGFVTEVNVNIGKFVSPTDVLFEIVDTEHLHAELTVFEKDVPRIRTEQKVRFTLANETRERTATVYLIGREISTDRTIRIHCHIDQEDKNLLPGMYLKAIVEAGGTQVNALPDEAIVDFQGKKYIFIPIEGDEAGAGHHEAEKADSAGRTAEAHEDHGGLHFKMIEIQAGNAEMGYTEVTLPEGINPATDVVIQGAYAILSKIKNSEDEGHAH
jgi:cobalt-zinc-cadmium efflux system membrane fusion protein